MSCNLPQSSSRTVRSICAVHPESLLHCLPRAGGHARKPRMNRRAPLSSYRHGGTSRWFKMRCGDVHAHSEAHFVLKPVPSSSARHLFSRCDARAVGGTTSTIGAPIDNAPRCFACCGCCYITVTSRDNITRQILSCPVCLECRVRRAHRRRKAVPGLYARNAAARCSKADMLETGFRVNQRQKVSRRRIAVLLGARFLVYLPEMLRRCAPPPWHYIHSPLLFTSTSAVSPQRNRMSGLISTRQKCMVNPALPDGRTKSSRRPSCHRHQQHIVSRPPRRYWPVSSGRRARCQQIRLYAISCNCPSVVAVGVRYLLVSGHPCLQVHLRESIATAGGVHLHRRSLDCGRTPITPALIRCLR